MKDVIITFIDLSQVLRYSISFDKAENSKVITSSIGEKKTKNRADAGLQVVEV